MIDTGQPTRRPRRCLEAFAAWLLAALLVVAPSGATPAGAAGASAEANTAVAALGVAVASFRLEARYDVTVHLDWDTRRVDVSTTIDLINTSGSPVDRLKLNTVAAKLGSMQGLRVRVNGARVQANVEGQTIDVPLGAPLAEGGAANVSLAFRARLRTTGLGRSFLFSRLAGVAQLYRFIPWLSRTIRFGSQGHGEPFLTPASPLVRVTVSSDRTLNWATSGRSVGKADDGTATFVARDVRDFAIAASPDYRTVRGMSMDGETVILAHSQARDGRRLVTLARRELARFERLTGVPYPYPTFRVAVSGGGMPMEAPGLIWIPGTRSAADQPFLVSHETAHQWWYGLVGNDQSTNAFADEAMADYFSRKAHLSIRPSRCPTERLDRDIREYSSACYFEVIYVQGARFLDDLRRDFGTGAFKRAIRTYTTDYRLGMGGNAKLLEALRLEMGDGVLGRYRKRFPSLY